MAQTLLTHEQMIENLIGEFSPSEHPELFKAGFHFVADLIPADHELWASDNLRGQTIPADGAILRNVEKHLKVISVWRRGHNVWMKCKEIPWDDFRKGGDSTSIYSTVSNSMTPVYSISDGGRLFMAPNPFLELSEMSFFGDVPLGVLCYFKYWAYEHNDFFGVSDAPYSDTFDSYHIPEDLYGFPRDAQLPAVIKSAMNILQVKMGESVHEDEDQELLQLQQVQMQQLQQWFESEMARLNVKYKIVGLEEG